MRVCTRTRVKIVVVSVVKGVAVPLLLPPFFFYPRLVDVWFAEVQVLERLAVPLGGVGGSAM